jgi:tripartite-type tricarboxylate transporter receptor subunit TctC
VVSLVFGIVNLFLYPGFALAAYPEKPVTLICVWGAGGANDLIAREIAETMKKYFPKPLAVVNRPGGAGTIGTAEIATARPDGYTIGTTTMSAIAIKPHQMKLPYKTPDDYMPIALVGTQADVLSVLIDGPFKTLKDFIEYAKGNPGKLRVATAGVGHFTDVILEMLRLKAKIDVVDVPTKSGSEQIAMQLGRHVEGNITTVLEALPYIQGGKLRSLALADEKRSPLLPDVPTFRELGYDITLITYTVLIGPKGLPSEVVSKLHEAYKKVSKDPSFIKFMDSQGVTVVYEEGATLKKRLWKDYSANKDIFEPIGEKKK